MLEVTILPPYVPLPEEVSKPRLYAANVRQLYADTLGMPQVEQVQLLFLSVLLMPMLCNVTYRIAGACI